MEVFQPRSLAVEALLSARAPQSSNSMSVGADEIEGEQVLLLGGYVDDSGRTHDEAQLLLLTGHDEYRLANLRDGACRAVVTTSLLSQCVKCIGPFEGADKSLIRSLLIGDRDYLIIRLRALTFGTRIDLLLACPDPHCGALMDLTIDLDDIEFERKPVTQLYFNLEISTEASAPGARKHSLELRLPNGGDQETGAALMPDEPAAIEELLKRCVRGFDGLAEIERDFFLSPQVRLEIEAKISELAPRAELDVETECPECRHTLNTQVDVASIFLDELAGGLNSLERDVHLLAWHYHWSENEILTMTRPRRRRYVALVEKEIDRLNQVW